MRLRRLSFVAGWAAVGLLAAVGFAAFGTSGDSAADISTEAAAANIGHTTGAYAGLTFAILGGDPGVEITGLSEDSVITDQDLLSLSSSSAAQPAESPWIDPSTGAWLSQVEVRALVSVYFEPEDVNTAVRVAWCESRFNPDSVDLRTGATGLFKHLPRYWPERADAAGFAGADPTDPEASVAAAAWAVYSGGGWDVFVCRG
jgi:hypothetical protein